MQAMGKKASSIAAELKADTAAKLPERLIALLRKGQFNLVELSDALATKLPVINRTIQGLIKTGYLLHEFDGQWSAVNVPGPANTNHVYKSRRDGTYVFGFASDLHLGSKYERLDVLHDLYRKFDREGVDRVFNCGNWIDGEFPKNIYDLHTRGMDAQIMYLVENLPQRKGITTYAVAGDDHEGWYGQREGIDVGRHCEQMFKQAGRTDWVNLGYMESFVTLKHARTGVESQCLVMHPGGGSSYAVSYRAQKIIESFSGGEKPGVLLIGHLHKMLYGPIRNVEAIQTGTTQDQTPFMRKKSLEAHVGGGICRLKQCPETGAITSCEIRFDRYYNTGFYNDRWNHGGPVQLPSRGVLESVGR